MSVTLAITTDPDGQGIILTPTDGSGNPTNFASYNSLATISIDGGPAITLAVPGLGTDASPYLEFLYFPLPWNTPGVPIGPSSVVTLSAAAGAWTTQAGDTPACVAEPVTNLVGGSLLPPFVVGPKTMIVGVNVGPAPDPTSSYPVYANLARHISGWSGGVAVDSLGYPPGGFTDAPVGGGLSNGVDGRGLKWIDGDGTWTVMYTTAPGSYDIAVGVDDSISAPTRTTAGADTVDAYVVAAGGGKYSPQVQTATNAAGVSGLRIYPPGVATDGSDVYHPAWLSAHQGMAILRFVVAIDRAGQGGASVVDYSDFRDPAMLGWSMITRTIGGTVTQAEPYDDTTNWFGIVGFGQAVVPVKLTFSAPHGIKPSNAVTIAIASGGPHGDGSFDTVGGKRASFGGRTEQVLVLSDTEIAAYAVTTDNTADALTAGVVAGDGTWSAVGTISPGIPWQDAIDRCNALRAAPWICLSPGMTDACVTTLTTNIWARLDAGLDLYLELGDETWNPGFTSNAYFNHDGWTRGLGPVSAGVRRSGEIFALAASVTPSDRAANLKPVFGTQAGNAAVTSGILSYAASQGIPVPRLAGDGYVDIGVFNGGAATLLPPPSALGPDHLMTLFELYTLHGRWESKVDPHIAAIAASAYPDCEYIHYECGPGTGYGWLGTDPLAFDSSGHDLKGSLRGTTLPTLVDSPWGTAFGKAMSFPGTDSLIDCGNLWTAGPFEITVQFQRSGTYNGHDQALAGEWGDASQGRLLYIDAADKLHGFLNTSAGTQAIVGSTAIIDTNPHEARFAWDGTHLHLDLDGVPATSAVATSGTPVASTAAFRIGGDDQAAPIAFRGIIGTVRLGSSDRYGSSGYTPPTTPPAVDSTTDGLWRLNAITTAAQYNIYLSHYATRHPRYRAIQLYILQRDQDAGVKAKVFFISTDQTDGFTANLGSDWTILPSVSTVAGVGDGSDGKWDNRTPDAIGLPCNDYDHIVSPRLDALATWQALVPPPSDPSPPSSSDPRRHWTPRLMRRLPPRRVR